PVGLQRVGSYLVMAATLDRWSLAVSGLGSGSHSRGRVLDTLGAGGVSSDLRDAVVAVLVDRGVLVAVDTGFALPEPLDEELEMRERRRRAVVHALYREPYSPPNLDEVARQHGADGRDVAALVQRGDLVRIGKVTFAQAAVDAAVRALRSCELAERPFTASE